MFLYVVLLHAAGERQKDAKHVYANPAEPAICPILALGLHLLCDTTNNSTSLFFGSSQEARFSQRLKKALKAIDLGQYGVASKDFGTHSFRKGAATYCLNGSTAAPSYSAVNLRAGWKFGGVQDTYVRYEAAADQFVGRVVCGLPLFSPLFAVVAPHFVVHDGQLKTAVRSCFPQFTGAALEALSPVLRFCLASVVRHREWLRTTAPHHPVFFQSSLFTSRDMADTLARKLSTAEGNSAIITATGIPPHVSLLEGQQKLFASVERKLDTSLHTIRSSVDRIPSLINEQIKSLAMSTGRATPQFIVEKLQSLFNALTLEIRNSRTNVSAPSPQAVSPPENGADNDESAPVEVDSVRRAYFVLSGRRMYISNGRYTRLPPQYKLPSATLRAGWSLWWLGSHFGDFELPPLREVSGVDFAQRLSQQEFSSWKTVFTYMEKLVSSSPHFSTSPDRATVEVLFDDALRLLDIPGRTNRDYHRRVSSMKVTSFLRHIRSLKKRELFEREILEERRRSVRRLANSAPNSPPQH